MNNNLNNVFDQKKRAEPFLAAVAGCVALTVYGVREAGAFLCPPLVLFYSGEHGWQLEGKHKAAAKYAFYAFYPIHLICLELAAFLSNEKDPAKRPAYTGFFDAMKIEKTQTIFDSVVLTME